MIVKSSAPFDWELVDAKGERVRRYWTTKETLEKGIEVDAELWNLTRETPNQISWIICGQDGNPLILAGKELIARNDDKVIQFYPARYRMRSTDQA